MRKNIRTKEQWEEAINKSDSVAQTLKYLGLFVGGGNYKYFHFNVRKFEINTAHFTGKLWSKGKTLSPKRPIQDYLIAYSPSIGSHTLRLRLIKEGLKEAKCQICGLTKWLGEPIPLQLDHENGDHFDNRFENLRILCPNCHAKTPTFCGKNKRSTKLIKPPKVRQQKQVIPSLCKCGKQKDKRAIQCGSCRSANQVTKIEWPEILELRGMVKDTSYVSVGKQLGVSDNAVRKHLKRYYTEGD